MIKREVRRQTKKFHFSAGSQTYKASDKKLMLKNYDKFIQIVKVVDTFKSKIKNVKCKI